jgi:adhesin transport system outer membrane protein
LTKLLKLSIKKPWNTRFKFAMLMFLVYRVLPEPCLACAFIGLVALAVFPLPAVGAELSNSEASVAVAERSVGSGVAYEGSLYGILGEAQLNHPQLAIKRSELAAAGYELDAAQWQRWPTVGLDTKAIEDGYQLTAKVEQPLWSGGRISGQIKTASAAQQVALLALSETRLDIQLETSNHFFEVLRLREQLRYTYLNEQEHIRLLEMIQRRVAANISPGSDAVLASSRMRRAMTTRLQTQRQLREAQVALERAVGQSVAIQTLYAPEQIVLGTRTLDRFLTLAQRYSPRRKRLLAAVNKAAADVDVARAQAMPTLVLGYEQNLGEAGDNRQRNSQAYLALSLQTGAGLSNRATVSAASSRRDVARDSIAEHERQLRQQVYSLWAEYVALNDQLAPMEAIVEGSELMVESYLRQFQVGKKSWLDVLNAQSEKAQAYFLKTDTVMPLKRAKFHLLVLSGQAQGDMLGGNGL